MPQTPFVGRLATCLAAIGMIQKLRVPLGFVLATGVLYFAQPTAASILFGLPVAVVGGVFRALAAGVVKKNWVVGSSGGFALARNTLFFFFWLLAWRFAVFSLDNIAAIFLLLPFSV